MHHVVYTIAKDHSMNSDKKDTTTDEGELIIHHDNSQQPVKKEAATIIEPDTKPEDTDTPANTASDADDKPETNAQPSIAPDTPPSDHAGIINPVHSHIGRAALQAFEEPAPAQPVNRTALSKRRKVLILVVLAAIGLISSIIGMYVYFSSHTLPFSYVGNLNVSFLTREQLQQKITEQASATKITLNTENGPVEVNQAEIGASIKTGATADAVFQQQSSLLDKLQLWQKRSSQYQYELDTAKTTAYFDAIKKATDTGALNATIAIDNGAVSITPEVVAKVSGVKNAESSIRTALASAQPVTLNLEIYEEQPKIKAVDLEKSKSQIEQIINVPITLSINGKVITATKSQIGSWITVTPNETEKSVDISLDNVKVASYVESTVKPYIKPPRAKVVVKNPDGSERELSPGEDGVDVVNKQSVTSELISKINQRQAVRLDVPVAYASRQTIYAGDYEKWIEVDLTSKRMYAYERGNLVNTFLVTAGAPDTPTVTGEFKIQTKVRKQTMRGLNTDGSSYNVPNVEWVNYFYQDYAIHGNYWRPDSVFGNTNTSHGCVSLKNDGAQWIYNWAPIGTPVITHY